MIMQVLRDYSSLCLPHTSIEDFLLPHFDVAWETQTETPRPIEVLTDINLRTRLSPKPAMLAFSITAANLTKAARFVIPFISVSAWQSRTIDVKFVFLTHNQVLRAKGDDYAGQRIHRDSGRRCILSNNPQSHIRHHIEKNNAKLIYGHSSVMKSIKLLNGKTKPPAMQPMYPIVGEDKK